MDKNVMVDGDLEIGPDYIKLGDNYIINPGSESAHLLTRWFKKGYELGDQARVRKIKGALNISK